VGYFSDIGLDKIFSRDEIEEGILIDPSELTLLNEKKVITKR
jgi:hypothetical protein